MESVLGRYRNLIILVGVLFLQVLGLAVQVKSSNTKEGQEGTRLIRIWAVGTITPLERCVVWVQNSTGNIWHNYFYLRGVRAENRQLKERIEQMRLEQVRLSEDAAQAHRLQTLLAFKERFMAKTVAAQVIGSSGSDLSRIIYIDKGEDDGLKRDMPVITADGIVGKVLAVWKTPSVSQVLLINDQSSGVGALLEKSRLQGVLRTPNGEVALERVMADEQVPVGEIVLTSGGDQIFPKGLPVGTITKVGNGKDLFLNIKVKPASDLSKLEEVLVLVERQDRQVIADDSTRGRAADILAQRLPSVPDKPAPDPAAVHAGNNAAETTGATPAAAPAKSPAKTEGTPHGNSGTAVPAKALTPALSAKPVAAPRTSVGATDAQTTAKPANPQVKPISTTQTPPKPPKHQSDLPTPADETSPH
jgi:rod shape-determining protein MreC